MVMERGKCVRCKAEANLCDGLCSNCRDDDTEREVEAYFNSLNMTEGDGDPMACSYLKKRKKFKRRKKREVMKNNVP